VARTDWEVDTWEIEHLGSGKIPLENIGILILALM